MILVLSSASSAMFPLSRAVSGLAPAASGRYASLAGNPASPTRLPVAPRSPTAGRASASQYGPGVGDVLTDLGDQRLDAVVRAHLPQVCDEVQGDPLAVEVAVEVQRICLDPPLPPGKRGVRPDRHGRHVPR